MDNRYELKAREVLGGPECPNATANHILVMLVLLAYGKHGEEMRPAHSTLVAETSTSLTVVKRVLRDLEGWGAIEATERPDRSPVVWGVGPLLQGDPAPSHQRALAMKSAILRAKAKAKPEPDPARRTARAVKQFLKYRPDGLVVERNDECEVEVMAIPYGTTHQCEEVLDGERAALPTEYDLPEVTVRPRKYASFRAADVRDVDGDDNGD